MLNGQQSTGVLTMPAIVTLFGDNDVLDHALSDELGRRGTRTHNVTVATGWLSSAEHAVLRLDTPSGDRALTELSDGTHPCAHIVAVAERPLDDDLADRLDALCRRCGEQHDISLILHGPLDSAPVGEAALQRVDIVPADNLAATVADKIAQHASTTSTPAFERSTFDG